MTLTLHDSVVLITSREPGNKRFGTGFVMAQTDEAAYVLTCAHVVDDVGGPEQIDVEGQTATVAVAGAAAELDLAVLRLPGHPGRPPLTLQTAGQSGSKVRTAGFQLFGSHHLVRDLSGRLGGMVALALPGRADRVPAWDLLIEDDYTLQPGYSGSPVVDQAGGQVLAVVSHRQGQGQRGLAISIEALPTLWPDMPALQLTINNEQLTSSSSLQPSSLPTLQSSSLPTLQSSNLPADQVNQKGVTVPRPIKLFFSYAHEDENLRDELAKHLRILERQGIIAAWYDRDITAGMEWADAIDDNLDTADIILLLVSPDFMASDYCWDKEMKRAMARHEAREAIVIPVILRKTNWTSAPFSKLQALPKNAKPVKSWSDQDEAFTFISEQIQKVAEMMASRPAPSSTPLAPTPTPPTSTPPGTTTSASTATYNTGAIRRLLTAAYDDFGFDILCTDNFPEVSAQFSRGMSLAEKIQRLIVYCQQHLVFPHLLNLVKQERPAMYEQYQSQLIQ